MTFQKPKKVIIFAHANLSHQVERAESFRRGMIKHGYSAEVQSSTLARQCDLAVFWGMHHSRSIRAQQDARNLPWLVMERGYVGDRFHWTSLGYNGLNGRADFLNDNMDSDRWNRHFSQYMKPWRNSGEYVLVTGQVPGDASLERVGGRVDYESMVNQIRKYTDRPIHFRPHPKRNIPCPRNATLSTGTLEQALSNAWCVVTYNSNSGVDAILNGIPAFVIDYEGSMSKPIAMTDFNLINNPQRFDRTQWANNIAYAQWSPEEIENGTAWEHLKRKFE